MAKPPKDRTVCVNRKARHDYEILDRFEAGLVLVGSEAKALREGQGNLVDAYVMIRDGRPVLHNLEISRYSHDTHGDLPTRRQRGLLLNKAEIRKLGGRLREQGLALIPLSIYFKGPWAKLELGLAKGRRKADKRQALRKKAADRDVERALRRR